MVIQRILLADDSSVQFSARLSVTQIRAACPSTPQRADA